MLDKVIGDRFGLIPPISFYGKSHTKENAHELFAVVVDVDYVGKQQLKNLLKQFGMVCSFVRLILSAPARGTSLLFLAGAGSVVSKPEEVLAELKEAFIRRLWNDTSSIRPGQPGYNRNLSRFPVCGESVEAGCRFPSKSL
ncbi:hypothetical protein FORC46_p0060 (plasmid) [Campylobacter jejuni]|nr:hypothetical protein FORC46_p0060 [Campylobacter jejuni]